MTINIMNEYIELTKKQINEYMKLTLGEKFNQNYCDLFTERYVNIRYFNYYENEFYELDSSNIYLSDAINIE